MENCFDLSFVIKDGSAGLSRDADGLYLEPTSKPKTDDYKNGVVKVQNILKIDHPTYKQLVKRWCTAERPYLLPSRDDPTGQWADEADEADAATAADAPPPKSKKGKAS